MNKHEGKAIVLVGGCFDVLHYGHISFLEQAKKQGDVLVVLLESDAMIKKRKGINRPIHTQDQRAYMLSRITDVDIVIKLPDIMTNDTYDSLIQTIRPHVIAVSENDAGLFHKQRQAKLVGAKIVAVTKYIQGLSTTSILTILSKEL